MSLIGKEHDKNVIKDNVIGDAVELSEASLEDVNGGAMSPTVIGAHAQGRSGQYQDRVDKMKSKSKQN